MIVGISNGYQNIKIKNKSTIIMKTQLNQKKKKRENKNIFMVKKSYSDLVIIFTRYHPDKSAAMISLYYNELVGKIKGYEEKNI